MKKYQSKAVFLTFFLTLLFSPNIFSSSFVEFESGQVRPLALSPDGTRLFAVNTPDNRLEIFDVTSSGLNHTGSIPVGMEPVAIAARNNNEVWVVNHLSDSVSIVDVSVVPARVTKTLLVGDEPSDIVFAGTGGNRAFITTAHRGQQRTDASLTGISGAGDPQLTTAGVGRADVWVFDATNLGSGFGGTPIKIVVLFGDTPRPLAVSPDRSIVYAGIFHSGNQTTTVNEVIVCNGGSAAGPCVVGGNSIPGGLPAPNGTSNAIVGGKDAPETGLIVKFDNVSGQWRDQLGRNWSNAVKFTLPDKDVFAIDANATLPVETAFYTHVGTVLFNMITNPITGKVYVSNTDAKNEVRFEGPGIRGGSTVRGHLAESRISILSGSTVTPRHLNKHINYSTVPQPADTKTKSLAAPTGMAISSDGSTLYVAAFGSSKIGVFNTAELENNTFVPDASNHISVSGGGPSGLVLDEAHNRLYVLTRFNDAVSVVDLTSRTEIQNIELFNPEPATVTDGRQFLYDANFTSSNGEASCSSCHIFGNMDDLGWDLGNPDGSLVHIPFAPNEIKFGGGTNDIQDYHPIKGPMTTQTLRGMVHSGAMHWRGDRTGGNDPGGSPFDSNAAFLKFNVAFEGLVGRDEGQIPDFSMQAFADFILQVTLPPNPVRNLDNSLTSDQTAGQNIYLNRFMDGVSSGVAGVSKFQCNGCHLIDPANGLFGTDRTLSFENETQLVKVPHLRNAYQKVGMFGMAAAPGLVNGGDNGNKGDQVRGFGFLHDGSVDTIFRFVNGAVFNHQGSGSFGFDANTTTANTERRQIEQFLLSFPSDLAPIVGQQITLNSTNGAAVNTRINLLIARANAGDCDLIVKGVVSGFKRGWVWNKVTSKFTPDKSADPEVTDAALRTVANTPSSPLTYTAVPVGSGRRMGIDHDEDNILDGDDNTPPQIGSFQPANLNQTVNAGSFINFSVSASDSDLDVLTYTWKLDNVAIVGNNSNSWVYTPTAASEGAHTVRAEVSDGIAAPVSVTWNVTVKVNHPPVITSKTYNGVPIQSSFQATVNQRYLWTIDVQDPDDANSEVHQLTVTLNDGTTTIQAPACGAPSSADFCVARVQWHASCSPPPHPYYVFYILAKPDYIGKTIQLTFTPMEALPNVNPGPAQTVIFNVINPNPAQNPVNRLDVNHDGSVTSADAQAVIDRLTTVGIGHAPTPTASPSLSVVPATSTYYYDVNGDHIISPIDALQVINALLKQKSK